MDNQLKILQANLVKDLVKLENKDLTEGQLQLIEQVYQKIYSLLVDLNRLKK